MAYLPLFGSVAVMYKLFAMTRLRDVKWPCTRAGYRENGEKGKKPSSPPLLQEKLLTDGRVRQVLQQIIAFLVGFFQFRLQFLGFGGVERFKLRVPVFTGQEDFSVQSGSFE